MMLRRSYSLSKSQFLNGRGVVGMLQLQRAVTAPMQRSRGKLPLHFQLCNTSILRHRFSVQSSALRAALGCSSRGRRKSARMITKLRTPPMQGAVAVPLQSWKLMGPRQVQLSAVTA
mmetsp:Transcript_37581/g.86856  ORF Transcript_37581/g.86856 Transcript_37581/m.86856 type:complete len:117 (-) Transcript_37581:904-1254(-)